MKCLLSRCCVPAVVYSGRLRQLRHLAARTNIALTLRKSFGLEPEEASSSLILKPCPGTKRHHIWEKKCLVRAQEGVG